VDESNECSERCAASGVRSAVCGVQRVECGMLWMRATGAASGVQRAPTERLVEIRIPLRWRRTFGLVFRTGNIASVRIIPAPRKIPWKFQWNLVENVGGNLAVRRENECSCVHAPVASVHPVHIGFGNAEEEGVGEGKVLAKCNSPFVIRLWSGLTACTHTRGTHTKHAHEAHTGGR
jgi:hypothetical protein